MSKEMDFQILFDEIERLQNDAKCEGTFVSGEEMTEMDEIQELRDIIADATTPPLITYTTS